MILIDAVSSGARPGTIYCIDAQAQPLPAGWTIFSTHAFGIAEPLALARSLGQLPPDLRIYGIEGEQFAATERFSPPVKQAIKKVINMVLLDLSACHHRSEPHQGRGTMKRHHETEVPF